MLINKTTLKRDLSVGKYPKYSSDLMITDDKVINQLFKETWLHVGPNYRNYLKPENDIHINFLCYSAVKNYILNQKEYKKLIIINSPNVVEGTISTLLQEPTSNHNTVLFCKHKLLNPDWDNYLDVNLSRLLTTTVKSTMLNDNVSCRLYKTKNNIIIFSNREPCWEIVYTALTICLKLLYDPTNQEFLEISKILNKKNHNTTDRITLYSNILKEFIKSPKIDEMLKNKEYTTLANFLKPNTTKFIRDIEKVQRTIITKELDLSKEYETLYNLQFTLAAALNTDVENIVKTFLTFKNQLKNIDINYNTINDVLELFIKKPIMQYDVEAYKKCFPLKAQDKFNPIFLDEKYRLYTITGIYFTKEKQVYTYGITTLKNYYNCIAYKDLPAIPHPHINRYNCLGNNKTEIIKFLQNNKLEKAIICSVAAAENFNFKDITVTNTFINEIRTIYRDTPCIENIETGEMLSYAKYEKEILEKENL